MTEIEKLRAELAAKRAENAATEEAQEASFQLNALRQDIEIEDKLKEAYAAGKKKWQILDLTWRGLGRCLAIIPNSVAWNAFAKKSGILQGELKNDPAIHEELAVHTMLVPDGKRFLELARELNPNAPFDLTNAVASAMRAERNERGK